MKILEIQTDQTPTGEWATYEVFQYPDGRTVGTIDGFVKFDLRDALPEIEIHGHTGVVTIALPKLTG